MSRHTRLRLRISREVARGGSFSRTQSLPRSSSTGSYIAAGMSAVPFLFHCQLLVTKKHSSDVSRDSAVRTRLSSHALLALPVSMFFFILTNTADVGDLINVFCKYKSELNEIFIV